MRLNDGRSLDNITVISKLSFDRDYLTMAEPASFKQRTVQCIVQECFRDEKTKMNSEAVALLVEVMNIFVSEAVLRSMKEAKTDFADEVTVEHFEKIVPQLMLDL